MNSAKPGMNSSRNAARPSSNSSVLGKVKDTIAGQRDNVLIFSVVAFVVLIAVISYIVYRVTRRDLTAHSILEKPRKLFHAGNSKPFIYDSEKLPENKYGNDYAYSFWIYLDSFTVTDTPKLVFLRGYNGKNIGSASPIVYIDAKTNQLSVSLRTNSSITSSNLAQVRWRRGFLTATIEYLPIARWVHVAMSVKENILTLYMDGEIYSVQNVLDMPTTRESPSRPILAKTGGDVVVGSLPDTSNTKGYITALRYFNHNLSINDVKSKLYDKGPYGSSKNSVMSKIGLASYGVRSPVYRHSDVQDEDRDNSTTYYNKGDK